MAARPHRLLALALGSTLAAVSACRSHDAHAPAALDQRVFVWQRLWSADVAAAVRGVARGSIGPVQGLDVLVADLDLRPRAERPAPPRPDWTAIASVSLPVGLVVRIGPFSGLFAAGDGAIDEVAAATRTAFDDAAASGVVTHQLMLDLDVGTARLADFARWLASLRTRLPGVHVTITALPDWLTSPDFSSVARAVDGYVLQLHALGPPRDPEDRHAVYDPARAAAAVERASRLGLPYRVALPTYGYEVGFDAEGRVLGAVAEGAPVAWPRGTATRVIAADPAEVAASVNAWARHRPAALEGIVWFRLPVDGDRLVWSASTLRAVMAGEAPRPRLTVEARQPESSLVEIDVLNTGDADLRGAVSIELRIEPPDTVILARDAVGGFRWRDSADGHPWLVADAGSFGMLRASERRTVGWVRANSPLKIEVERVDVRP